MTESSERSLRAEGRGKRLWFTRRRRLRTGREATLRSDEHRATGAASGGAASKRRAPGNRSGEQRGNASRHRVAGLPGATGSEAPAEATGAPQLLPRNLRFGGAIERGHGQPGQRERRQDAGPGNRSRVQLRERRSVRRQDRLEAAPLPGNRWWRHRRRSRATGDRAKMGIARRAFGHDGRCVGRAKANARRSTSGGSSHLREAPGGCAGASRPHRPGRLTFSALPGRAAMAGPATIDGRRPRRRSLSPGHA